MIKKLNRGFTPSLDLPDKTQAGRALPQYGGGAERSALFSAGFTLIELIVAIGLFATIVSIAIGGFVSALRAQRQVSALLAVNSNISSAIEQMTREMRTSISFCENHEPDSFPCASPQSDICFINSNDRTVHYGLVIEDGQGYIVRGEADPLSTCDDAIGNDFKITGNAVDIENLQFVFPEDGLGGFVNEIDNGYMPRITISVSAAPKSADIATIITDIQTTVSARPSDGDI